MKIDGDHNLQDVSQVILDRVRSLGAYYTPDLTALAIARWAIRTGDENFLEPSAGAGALVCAAFSRAIAVSSKPLCRATAFDVDPTAIQRLNELPIDQLDVRFADFLIEDAKNHQQFDLILANPPFNRNHSLPVSLRDSLRERFKTKGAVGLWVPFLLHSLSFLKSGGRIASIVPRSALFTLHGDSLLTRLCSSFNSVGIYELTSKPDWSSFAEEAGAVILAEGYLTGTAESYDRGILHDDGSIEKIIASNSQPYATLLSHSKPLGMLAQLSIGAVTGRNNVFLLSEAERLDAGIAISDLRPVVSRRKHIAGIMLSAQDLLHLARDGQKTWLLSPEELTVPVSKYLESVSKAEQLSVVWFKKRNPWWKVQLAAQYDAVFTYMNDLGPRVVKLAPKLVCTNTLHRVEFHPTTSEPVRTATLLSPISTFGQLAAEKIGRAYSGGVLKFEIAEARSLPIVVSHLFHPELAIHVDTLLRRNELDCATDAVDQVLMPALFGSAWRDALSELQLELRLLREARRGNKKGKAS